MHFGDKNRFKDQDPTKLGEDFAVSILSTLAGNAADRLSVGEAASPATIDLVICSGDIAEVAKPKEFELGRLFLAAAIKTLQVSPHRVVFVPGNHDVSWSLCKKVDADREIEDFDDAEYKERIQAVKLRFYQQFLQNFYGSPDTNLTGVAGRTLIDADYGGSYLRDFDLEGGYPLSVAALNTCERETHKIHGGQLGEKQAQSLLSLWLKGGYERYVKIAVVHHNPLPTPPENRKWTEEWEATQIAQGRTVDRDWLGHYTADMAGFQGAELLKRVVKDADVHLVLHGHHHNPGPPELMIRGSGGAAPVLSVGSMGLKSEQIPPDQPLSCQLLFIETHPKPRLIALPVEWAPNARDAGKVTKGAHVPNPRSEASYDDVLDLPESWRRRLTQDGTQDQQDALSQKNRADAKQLEVARFTQDYRERVFALHSGYDLKNLGVLASETHRVTSAPQLDDLYVPLRFATEFNINKTNQGMSLDVDALLKFLLVDQFFWRFGDSEDGAKRLSQIKQDLLVRRSLALTGVAGAGKTTWIRYTFRRMREHPKTLPLLVELRAVAKFWSDHATEPKLQTIEAYLTHWLTEQVPEFPEAGITVNDLLSAFADWYPVLLVDGWDELGEMGVRFRELLIGMMRKYPRLLVIATSRPYGSGRPSHSDGFDPLHVQPLSEIEIISFAENFYRRCYQQEESKTAEQVKAMRGALARSSDAALMAKTPLLLTMMLFVNSTKRLPDKRHQLYEECLKSLLTQRPKQEGILQLHGEWCPPSNSGPNRIQIVAAMARAFQETRVGLRSMSARSPITDSSQMILVSKTTAQEFLPREWEREHKEGFLLWLCARAGVMAEDTEDNVWFVHLSFQEFLTAWHLKANVVGDQATERFSSLADSALWWETLLLWAALLNDESQERAQPLLASLIKQGHLMLAGMMLADGIGTDAQMKEWTGAFIRSITTSWPDQMERCLRAWQASQQKQRRDDLLAALYGATSDVNWVIWLRIKQVLEGIGDDSLPEIAHPDAVVQAPIQLIYGAKLSIAQAAQDRPEVAGRVYSAQMFAAGRVLSGASPLSPFFPESLLNLWPSERRRASLYLQRYASLGATREDLRVSLQEMQMNRKRQNAQVIYSLARILERSLERTRSRTHTRTLQLVFDNPSDSGIALVRDLARARARSIALDLALHLNLARSLDLTRKLYQGAVRMVARDLDREIDRYSFNYFALDRDRTLMLALARYVARDLVRDHDRDIYPDRYHYRYRDRIRIIPLDRALTLHSYCGTNRDRDLPAYALRGMEYYFAYMGILRSWLSTFRPSRRKDEPLLNLFAASARVSIYGDIAIRDNERAINHDRNHLFIGGQRSNLISPVWEALARHIARLSDESDQKLLLHAARDPFSICDPKKQTLAWGLQYIVRGDILLPDGSEVTLDELCADIGVEPYPFLEPMPDELIEQDVAEVVKE